MVAAAGPLNRFGGGRHLWLATVPVAESPLNGGLPDANEAQPIFFLLNCAAVHWPTLVAGAQSGELYHLKVME